MRSYFTLWKNCIFIMLAFIPSFSKIRGNVSWNQTPGSVIPPNTYFLDWYRSPIKLYVGGGYNVAKGLISREITKLDFKQKKILERVDFKKKRCPYVTFQWPLRSFFIKWKSCVFIMIALIFIKTGSQRKSLERI